jgi:hypothetical protein
MTLSAEETNAEAQILRIIARLSPRWVMDAMATRILERGANDTSGSTER